MRPLEAGTLLLGIVLVILAATAFDWRLGLGGAGCFLIASTLDLPRRRT